MPSMIRRFVSPDVMMSIRLLLLFYSSKTAAAPAVQGPAGIFVIGDTRPVAGEVAKFDLDFVSGYTLRMAWKDIESWDSSSGAPMYDFSRIDTTLEDLRARGKRMTLEILITKAPDYLMALPDTLTWVNPHPQQGGIQPLPWDANAQAAYAAMMRHMADHQIAGTPWRLADHPTLESMDSPIVGLQGLRELSGTLVADSRYDRETFIQSVLDSVASSREAFPAKFGFLALFAMNDHEPGDSLDEVVYARLMERFKIPGAPGLGFFQETLSDAGPNPDTLGDLLKRGSSQTYILFQALRPWELRPGETRPPEIASGTPTTGLRHAWSNYGSTYVELYGADILAAANQESLRKWNRFFQAAAAFRSGRERLGIELVPGSDILRWNADPILNYRLWSADSAMEWLPEPATSPSGEIQLVHRNDQPSRFFRVEVLPPEP
jgi:hypothetical protein